MKNNNNNAKLLNWLNKIPRMIHIIILLTGILISITLAYAAVNARAKANSESIREIKKKCDANEKAVISIKKDIEYIKEGVDEIKQEFKNSRSKK